MSIDRYAVLGNPVSHSKSPQIHAAFARQTGQTMEYSAQLVQPGEFVRAVEAFFDDGGKGLNITVPFKEEAWAMARNLSVDARRAGAVNTLLLDAEGQLSGHNTDGTGLVRDIVDNHGGELAGKHILILGAGGASRGILAPILGEKPATVTIANRTLARAQGLVEAFADVGEIQASGFEGLTSRQFDWVINATSASLQGELPPLPESLLAPGAWCYDLMYADDRTLFCKWATERGAEQAIDGLGMLVEQAAESFFLWRGVRPDTAAVIAGLRR